MILRQSKFKVWTVKNGIFKLYRYKWTNASHVAHFSSNNFEIGKGNLQAGMYFFTIESEGRLDF